MPASKIEQMHAENRLKSRYIDTYMERETWQSVEKQKKSCIIEYRFFQ